jgi:hypothetical protein
MSQGGILLADYNPKQQQKPLTDSGQIEFKATLQGDADGKI